MPKNSLNVSLKGADDIFSTEESRQEQQREQVQQIPIGELFPFKDHPFKVLDDESIRRGRMLFSVFVHVCSFYLFHISTFSSYIGGFMNENDHTTLEQAIYEEMELTPEMIRSIRTLCGVCLCSFVESKAFKIAIVPSADRSMDTCTVCQTRRGHDYVVMNR
jgi:hypothetical protein